MNATYVDAKHVLETVVLTFPFAKEACGVAIQSVDRTFVVVRGTDANPAAMLVMQQALDQDTKTVYQLAAAGVPGCSYLCVMRANLADGRKLVRAVVLPVIEFKAGSGV